MRVIRFGDRKARHSVVVLLSLLFGCAARYVDVSDQPKYASLPGSILRTTQELLIHSIVLDSRSNRDVDFYALMPRPGIGGREIVKRATLPVGAVIRVDQVMRCSNCLGRSIFPETEFLDFWVHIIEPRGYEDADVRLSKCGDQEIVTITNGGAVMSSGFFRQVAQPEE
jgi:hypothetical protein